MTDPMSPFQLHLARLRAPPVAYRIDRPCALDDGIATASDRQATAAELSGRLTCFVPSSGAATRLFAPVLDLDLRGTPNLDALRARAARDPDCREGCEVLARWDELPLAAGAPLPEKTDLARWIDALRDSGLPGRPKALLPFHIVDGAPSLPLRPHLAQALALADGPVVAHFTASADVRDELLAAARSIAAELPGGHRLTIQVSVQDPATDLPAIELDGRPVRSGDRYLCRPGGHGALLGNLPADADLVLIHNIDNAPHPDHLVSILPHRRRLLGCLIDLIDARAAHVRAVRANPAAASAARAWLAGTFGLSGPYDAASALVDLERPIRACGVVRNDGQPGGGPFWGPDPSGRLTPQIVETAELDRDDPAQMAALRASTHFNPVDLACALRDVDGRPYDLARFVDDRRWIVTTKTFEGRPIRCIERPGLWNGAMSGWLTRFVDMPPETFNPVKTVHDLLAPRHRGAR